MTYGLKIAKGATKLDHLVFGIIFRHQSIHFFTDCIDLAEHALQLGIYHTYSLSRFSGKKPGGESIHGQTEGIQLGTSQKNVICCRHLGQQGSLFAGLHCITVLSGIILLFYGQLQSSDLFIACCGKCIVTPFWLGTGLTE